VSTNHLIEVVWGDHAPPTADHALAVYASELRRSLGGGIFRSGHGYMLDVEPTVVDVNRFQAGARVGRQALENGDPIHAARTLASALSLFRGEPLSDVSSDALEFERERLRGLRVHALEDRIEADLALGRHLATVDELEQLTAAEPYRERPLRLLMVALYRSGRQADALDHLRAARRRFREELGLEPGPELRALERAILTHDPKLELPGHRQARRRTRPSPERRLIVVHIPTRRLWPCGRPA
jgi:DNA-binding SARP family transcriptional activator